MLCRVDYIITPLKILQALKESVTPDDDKYTFVERLSSQSADAYSFTDQEVCSQVTEFIKYCNLIIGLVKMTKLMI